MPLAVLFMMSGVTVALLAALQVTLKLLRVFPAQLKAVSRLCAGQPSAHAPPSHTSAPRPVRLSGGGLVLSPGVEGPGQTDGGVGGAMFGPQEAAGPCPGALEAAAPRPWF